VEARRHTRTSIMLAYTIEPTPSRVSATSGWIVVAMFFAVLALH
jgi:hypothetical protein